MTIRSSVWVLLAVLCALRVALWYATVSRDLPACLTEGDTELAAIIDSVAYDSELIRMDLTAIEFTSCQGMSAERIRAVWYSPPEVRIAIGDEVEVQIRLRRIWGTVNPGGFNYRLWQLGKGYSATGSIRALRVVTPAAGSVSPLVSAADDAIHQSATLHPDILRALAIGHRDGVSTSQWELFRATGTIHLMVVSGLHLGVLLILVRSVCSRLFAFGAPRRCINSVRHPVAFVALAVAAGYALATGLQAPVMRATGMLFVYVLCTQFARDASRWYVICAVFLGCLVAQPALSVQRGFWLSFLAVGALLWGFQPNLRSSSWVRGLLHAQLTLFVLLTPWLGVVVGDVPLASPLANLLVVPLMSLVTIPSVLTGVLLSLLAPRIGAWLIQLADVSLVAVLSVLEWVRQLELPSIGYFQTIELGLMLVAMACLTPLSIRLKLPLTLGLSTLMMSVPDRPLPGEFRVHVLDVGQGSGAVIDTRHHRVVVDTGARFPSGFDMGTGVIIPAVRSTGVDRVDQIFISHLDNDHAGGLASLQARYPSARVLLPHELTHERLLGDYCADGLSWEFDGVRFSVLRDDEGRTPNERSCGLIIEGRSGETVYLPGDIGKSAEYRLLSRMPQSIDLLVVPHHGSNTSSSEAFIRRVDPRWAIVSAGYRNQYGHPHEAVLDRYTNMNIVPITTARAGALMWKSRGNRLWRSRRTVGGLSLPLVSEVDEVSQVSD